MAFVEHLAGYMHDYGVIATSGSVSARGLFDNGYAAMLGMSGQNPTFICASESVATLAEGDDIAIDGADYVIAQIQADSHGVTTLQLEAA